MSTVTENDLKELKTFIDTQIKELDKKFENKLDKFDDKLDELDKKFENKLDKFDNKLDELDKKFDNKLDKFDNKLDELDKKFDNKLDKFDDKLDRILEGFNEFKVDITALKTELVANNKRLDNADFIIRSIFVGIVVTIFTTFLIAVFKLILPLFPNV
ncbi:hypothetical protein [Gloeocapsa sp. PCC 73106]|uniref:hypothetical protein n=1 Tax=Gloeocapsa sp. PCC 73106 TaxID=102232 RepID=UPI0002ACC9AF|nr:hypothetical protein [Gloeocapsa sp. PCC 73106]ELR98149.1 hypothetical protein GLO73106DRAFT_00019740 [Gloeocapsa sp. PCC 73106]